MPPAAVPEAPTDLFGGLAATPGADMAPPPGILPPETQAGAEDVSWDRWTALGGQRVAAIGLDSWQLTKTGPQGPHPWHAYATARADRVGRNQLQANPEATEPDWVVGFDAEISPAAVYYTSAPDTTRFLLAPPDRRAGVAHLANTLDGGRAPDQALAFVEGMADRYTAEVPAHGAASVQHPDLAPVDAAAFELARWDFAVQNLELTGENASLVARTWKALRAGETVPAKDGTVLADTMVRFAQQAAPIAHPELRLDALTVAPSGWDADTGGLRFTALAWEGKAIDRLSAKDAGDRLQRIAALHPSQLVELAASNVERTVTDLVSPEFLAAWRRSPAFPVEHVTRAALGVPLNDGFASSSEGTKRLFSQVNRGVDLAAQRVAASGALDVQASEVPGLVAAVWAAAGRLDDGKLRRHLRPGMLLDTGQPAEWRDGQGPTFLTDARVLEALTAPAMNHGLPVAALHVASPQKLRRVSVADFSKSTGDVDESDVGSRFVLQESGDGTFAVTGPDTIDAPAARGLYPTGLVAEGRRVWLNRTPAVVADVEAAAKRVTLAPGEATKVHIEPPAPVAFQPGHHLRIAPLAKLRDGRTAEAAVAGYVKELEAAGIRPAGRGSERPHRAAVATDDGVLPEARVDTRLEFSSADDAARAWELLADRADELFVDERLDRALYLNGPGEAPAGTRAVFERHHTDPRRRYLVTRSATGDPDDPATAVAYVPGDAGEFPVTPTRSEPAPLTLRADGQVYRLSSGAEVAPAPGVQLQEAEELTSLRQIRVRPSEGGQWRAPDETWISFEAGQAPRIQVNLDGGPAPVGPGLKVSVKKGRVGVVPDPDGLVDAPGLDNAVAWLRRHGVASRVEEYQ